jgi:hypothetical protein
MSNESKIKETERRTRALLPEEKVPKTVTGYHVETDLEGRTDITLTLRKGGTLSLNDLDPMRALLFLDLLRTSGPQVLAIWDPGSNRLKWRTRPSEEA